MRRRASMLINVLIILGLSLPGGLEAAPLDAVINQARPTVPVDSSEPADGPALSRKRAKTRQDRRQDRRHDAAQERKKDRNQAERKPDNTGKDQVRKRDRNTDRLQTGGQPVEITSGRLPAAETFAVGSGAPLSVEDRYIVVLEEDAGDSLRAANAMTATAGVVPTHVYDHVFNGFAAIIPDDQLGAIRNDSRVKAVVPDSVVHIAAQPVPTGIARINADHHGIARIDGIDERVDIDVAVIDTAGNDSHPDLNVWAFANCTDSPNDLDDQGHGTHVGGTIGALDNSIGVVGVAPGARLWNFRVLKANPGGGATGLNSWIICGLDLVTLHATDQGRGLGYIEVANASLGGVGADTNCQTDVDPYHLAYCRAVAAGVTVVVAAGNNAQNAVNVVPATYGEVITVSALADADGRPGGLGPATSAGADDTLATFSNFGADINIAAPGVDIRSTVPTGSCQHCDPSGYRQLNGTSMAAPHVAGAAALYLATHPNAAPQQVKTALLNTREIVALPNDPDGINEGVLRVVDEPAPAPPPPPTVDPTPATDDGAFTSKSKKNDKKKHKKHNKKKRKKKR